MPAHVLLHVHQNFADSEQKRGAGLFYALTFVLYPLLFVVYKVRDDLNSKLAG